MSTLKIKKRLFQDKLMLCSVCILAALTAVPLVAILGEVIFKGYDQLSWSFFTESTPTAYRAMKAKEEYINRYQREPRISEIAEKVGFPDASHFSKVFKQLMGKGPREFRKK